MITKYYTINFGEGFRPCEVHIENKVITLKYFYKNIVHENSVVYTPIIDMDITDIYLFAGQLINTVETTGGLIDSPDFKVTMNY
jgi:hypothetical protein